MRHQWWHDHVADQYFAVAVDERGEVVSAWMHAGGDRWEALDDFEPLRLADERGEIHVNTDPGGGTDELSSSLGPVQ